MQKIQAYEKDKGNWGNMKQVNSVMRKTRNTKL